jgi:hypothetical protein
MPRRSPRKKAISMESIVNSSSENEDFAAVASDDPYVACSHKKFLTSHFVFMLYSLDTDEDERKSRQNSNRSKKNAKSVSFVQESGAPIQDGELEEDEL